MLKKIILEDFMSHERTEIDLAPGLTVLTGPNNCGKSAVVAALQMLATNSQGTQYAIRHGATKCRVTLDTDDGHTIVWERKRRSANYCIDDEVTHRGTPESLQDILRLNRVEVEAGKATDKYDVHFGEQKSPVFLLGDAGSRAAAFFASASDAARLLEMQHLHRSNLADRRKEAKRLAAEQEKNERRLKAFEPLEQLAARVAAAEAAEKQIREFDQQIESLRQLVLELQRQIIVRKRLQSQTNVLVRLEQTSTTPEILQTDQQRHTQLAATTENLHTLRSQQQRFGKHTRILEKLVPPPAQRDVAALRSGIEQLRSLASRVERGRAVVGCCDRLVPPPELEPARQCEHFIHELANVTARKDSAVAAIAALDELHPPPTIGAAAPLLRQISELTAQERKVRRAAIIVKLLVRLRPHDDPVDTVPLADSIGRLAKAAKAASIASQKAEAATREIANCEQRLRAFVGDHPTCETCGGKIDPETLMSAVPSLHSCTDLPTDGGNHSVQ